MRPCHCTCKQRVTPVGGEARRLLQEWHNPPMHAKHSWFRRLLRWLAVALLLWVLASILLVLVLRFVPPPTSAFMIERRIEALGEDQAGFQFRYRWTPMAEISSNLPIALVASEDQKFPEHHGFDVKAIQNALADAEEGARLRGASTISQQVAKNLFLWNGRSYLRKGLEAWYTVLIEALWPKRRILEVYLNIAEFGDGTYGAAAASERYFHTTPAKLSPRQSALLAAVLPNPRRFRVDQPSAHVQRRATWIERQVRQLGGPGYLVP